MNSATNHKSHEKKLIKIFAPLSRISFDAYQRFANEAKSIEVSKSADGKGLSTGADIDYHLVNGFLPDELGSDFDRYQKGEADVKISEEPASFKTLNGKGDTALSWSKNPENKKDGTPSINRKFLENPHPMIMYVRETKQWWKRGPKQQNHDLITWNREVKSGFYIINMVRAAEFIVLKQNNKSDAIIDSQDMYRMLLESVEAGNFVEVPEPNKVGRLRFSFNYEN